MGYKQNPLNVLKGQTTNKAVGLAHGDSMAMQTDPKDGVVVTGKDKSMSAADARAARLAKRDKELALKKEAAKIKLANKREEANFNAEERKAASAANRQRVEQKLKKKRGQISEDAEDTSTNYSAALQLDPKDGNKKEFSPGANAFQDPIQTERNTRFVAPGPAAQPNRGIVTDNTFPTAAPKKTASGKTAVTEYTFPSTGTLNARGYTQFKNNSTRSTFNDAFRQARDSGAKTFQFGKSDYQDGKIKTYSTKLKG